VGARLVQRRRYDLSCKKVSPSVFPSDDSNPPPPYPSSLRGKLEGVAPSFFFFPMPKVRLRHSYETIFPRARRKIFSPRIFFATFSDASNDLSATFPIPPWFSFSGDNFPRPCPRHRVFPARAAFLEVLWPIFRRAVDSCFWERLP